LLDRIEVLLVASCELRLKDLKIEELRNLDRIEVLLVASCELRLKDLKIEELRDLDTNFTN